MTKTRKADELRTKQANTHKTKKVKAKKASRIENKTESGSSLGPHKWVIEGTGKDTYTVLDGVRIAKLGRPGAPQAGEWIPLAPGYEVFEGEGFSAIVIDKFEPPIQ